jgi:hypothetical protein
MKFVEDLIHLHTFALVCSFIVYLAGVRWWNNGQSRPYNMLVIIGTILFSLVVILRVVAEFSN